MSSAAVATALRGGGGATGAARLWHSRCPSGLAPALQRRSPSNRRLMAVQVRACGCVGRAAGWLLDGGRRTVAASRCCGACYPPTACHAAFTSPQAYQDAPSSPWPRQQPAPQQPPPTAPAGGNGNGTTGTAAGAAQQAGSQQSPPRRRVARYAGLSAAQFQHPLDQQNTRLLRALPGLEMVARNMMGPVAEQVGHCVLCILQRAWHLRQRAGGTLLPQPAAKGAAAFPLTLVGCSPFPPQVLLLENIGTSIKVGPQQLPSLHSLLTEAAAMLEMEAPDLYVRQVSRLSFTLLLWGCRCLRPLLASLPPPAPPQAAAAACVPCRCPLACAHPATSGA